MSKKAAPQPVDYVDASPTKRFFITVLIKDIDFLDALVELIDNSVDAVRQRCKGKRRLSGFVKVSYSHHEITVHDNGSGISIAKARESAFRFGRSESIEEHTVGAFGVGMKRALFKIGRDFSVFSATYEDSFLVEVDVDAWEKTGQESAADWTFPMLKKETNLHNEETGTRVDMRRLHEYSLSDVRSKTFLPRLKDKIQYAHEESIAMGLEIYVNGERIESKSPELLKSRSIVPLHKTIELNVDGALVSVSLYAGIGEPRLSDAGWYVFCNGRQIERAEKSKRTGWDSVLEEGDATPRPHWQFRRFRGYIYFDSDVPQILPWNTMKTGLNTESPVYRRVQSNMVSALREVITFLNAVDAEEDQQGSLNVAISKAVSTKLGKLNENAYFKAPKSETPVSRLTRISYQTDKDMVDAVKSELNVNSNSEVGQGTFDFYVKAKKLI